MKKILFFIPTLGGGGAEKVLVNLVNNLDKNKYKITVMTLFDYGINKGFLEESIEYKYIFKRVIRGNIHFLKLFPKEYLFKKFIKDRYDIIVSYLQGPTTRIIAGCNYDSKLIAWMHNEINAYEKFKEPYRSEKELVDSYNSLDEIISVAKTVEESFKNNVKGIENVKYEVVYNTLETEKIIMDSLEGVDDIDINGDYINLISVGRFAKQKGYERLIKIMAKLIKEDNFKIKLYLLGDGELIKEYKRLLEKFNIEKNVVFLGYKNNPYKYLRVADLFVCSSYHEGYSTAVTESLIVGTPVITTLCSGMTELLGENNEYGVIVENDDNALYEGIKHLIIDKKNIENLKKKAIERGKKFEKKSTVNSVEKIFDSLLERRE